MKPEKLFLFFCFFTWSILTCLLNCFSCDHTHTHTLFTHQPTEPEQTFFQPVLFRDSWLTANIFLIRSERENVFVSPAAPSLSISFRDFWGVVGLFQSESCDGRGCVLFVIDFFSNRNIFVIFNPFLTSASDTLVDNTLKYKPLIEKSMINLRSKAEPPSSNMLIPCNKCFQAKVRMIFKYFDPQKVSRIWIDVDICSSSQKIRCLNGSTLNLIIL